MIRLLAVAFVGALLAAPASGNDLLVVGGSWVRSADGRGTTAELTWVHRDAEARSWILGLRANRQFGSNWKTLRLGRVFRPRDGLTLLADTEFGPGRDNRGDFTYQNHRLESTITLAESQWYGQLEARRVAVADTRGTLLRAGLLVLPQPGWEIRAGYRRTVSGNLDTALTDLNVERRFAQIRWILGMSLGRQRAEVAGFITPADGDSAQIYAGAAFRLGAGEIRIVLDSLEIDDFHRRGILAAWKLPLGDRP